MDHDVDEELLAPPRLAAVRADVLGEPEPVMACEGLRDPQDIVEVWIPERHLTKVRVASVWRSKLRRGTLADCFTHVFNESRVKVAPEPPSSIVRLAPPAPPRVPTLSRSSLRMMKLAFAAVDRRFDELEAHPKAAEPEARDLHGSVDGVEIRLDHEGHPLQVAFDHDWLDEASVDDIAWSVLDASERARRHLRPVAPVPDPLEDPVSDANLLLTGLRVMTGGARDGV